MIKTLRIALAPGQQEDFLSEQMIVDAHLDISWNAIAEGSGFTGEPALGHLVSRTGLAAAGVGLVFATI
jgi:hypothetical protein